MKFRLSLFILVLFQMLNAMYILMGRIAILPVFSSPISNAEGLNIIHAYDWVSVYQLPVITETAAQVVVLLGCFKRDKYVWKQARA